MSESTPSSQSNDKELIAQLEQEISFLKSLVNAYENLSIFKEIEFREIRSTINAYEKLQDLQSKEKDTALSTLDAYKRVSELKTEELKDTKEIIHAYEELSKLHDRELRDARMTIDAMENASELTKKELQAFTDRFNNNIQAMDHPIQKEIFEILDEDHDNEQHLLMKLNLLHLRRNDENFYSHLFNVLINLDFSETEAKTHWEEIIALNKRVSQKLERKVSFRVSLLDYFIDLNKHIKNPKIIELKFFESALTNAIFDKLTGLLNRTHLAIAVRSSIRNARREKKLASLVMFDLDNFKRYNDFFGHPEGDKLLKSFGEILASTFVGNNTAFRYGGEEFLAVVETKNENEIQELADKARSRLQAKFENCILPVSVSGGYAVFPDDGNGLDELLSKADQALYDAKYSGKNIVLKYSENRRKNSRLFTSRDIIYRLVHDPKMTEHVSRTMDVSMGGLAIEVKERLNVQDEIEIFLDEKKRDDSTKLIGCVCWIKQKASPSEDSYIAGIEFDDTQRSSEIYKYYMRNM